MTALIEHFGALGVFLLMVPESACIPVPSEVTLLFSGFAVSQHWMSLVLAIGAATAGNLVVPFVVMTTLGCALWAAVFVLVGLASGAAWGTVSSVFGKAVLAGLAAIAVAGAFRLSRRRR